MLDANNDIDFATNNSVPIEEVIAQMEKELSMSGESWTFKHASANELINELALHLKKIDSGTRIDNLLYRIDVHLSKINTQLPYYESLAVLAWNRVFQKVWFRKNFKTENK